MFAALYHSLIKPSGPFLLLLLIPLLAVCSCGSSDNPPLRQYHHTDDRLNTEADR